MHTDIVASMIIYTVATVAFYLLGAGVLNGMERTTGITGQRGERQ